MGNRKRTYQTRCNWAGTSCEQHGRKVRAASAREALNMVVDGSVFGPLHQQYKSHDAGYRIAYVKPYDIGELTLAQEFDVRHGAIDIEVVR